MRSAPSGSDPDARADGTPADDPYGVPRGARRVILVLFAAGWVVGQSVLALVNKFELPSLRYVNICRFAWTPYSTPSLQYEVSLYVRGPGGRRDPIPDAERYVHGLWSPGPVELRAPNHTVEEVQERYAHLLEYIADDKADGREYMAVIRWIKHYRPDLPKQWRMAVKGSAGR